MSRAILPLRDRIVAERSARTRHARHAGRFHRLDRLHLVAHQANDLGRGADEDETGFLDALGEVGILGKESVAGMDRLRVGDFGGRDDRGHVEIAFRGRRGTDADRFVGHADVLEVAIDSGMNGDRADAERMARAQHAKRDLAAVGDDDLVEHARQPITKRGSSNSTGWPLPTSTASTVPLTSASI